MQNKKLGEADNYGFDVNRLWEIYKSEPSMGKYKTATVYGNEIGINVTPTFQRQVSRVLYNMENENNEQNTDTNQYSMLNVRKLSAMNEDGTVMTIEEYCEFYNIPRTSVKSWKLVTHTNEAYYNIASKVVENEIDAFEFRDMIVNSINDINNRPLTIERIKNYGDEHLLVLDPCDIHIGKLASAFEVGHQDAYNVEIACQRVRDGVEGIIQKTKGFNIDKILFIAGNDILHTDNTKRTTTNNTPQDTDGMWHENFIKAKELYIEVLNRLLKIADIHYVHVCSNHDYMMGFLLSEVVATYFNQCENITFDVSPTYRKYYKYHSNLIGTAHGDYSKNGDLPLAMAHEAKEMWSTTEHRYIYTHHVHHKTSKDYMGICVESLRSASGADSWHHKSLYQHAPKAIEAFLHHKENGQIARITHIF